MAKEIELKLRLNTQALNPIREWLNAHAEPLGRQTLLNDYYDTPDLQLAGAHAALRIRKKGDRFEQTFKARSASDDGIPVRHEWNWPLTSRALDTSVLALPEVQAVWPEVQPVWSEPTPESAQNVETAPLSVVFSTDFQREAWIYQDDTSRIEVVLDQGEVSASGATEPLCELELELLSGSPESLWTCLERLSDRAPMWLSDVSKAERGYRLAGVPAQHYHPLPAEMENGQQAHWQDVWSASLFNVQRACERLVFEQAPVEELWLWGYPLWCAAPDCQPLRALLEAALAAAVTPGSNALSQSVESSAMLTQTVRLLAGLRTKSHLASPEAQQSWVEARSRVADVIECNDTQALTVLFGN